MSQILNIETSGALCSVSLSANKELVHYLENNETWSHASRLSPLIEQLLDEGNTSYKELSAIAVSIGPGSYTGLRIGLSTAKGLCFALGIPLISISSNQIIAQSLIGTVTSADVICTMIDARRMEVYMAAYSGAGNVLEATRPVVLTDWQPSEIYTDKCVHVLGSGADKVKDVIKNVEFKFYSSETNPLNARNMVHISNEKYAKKDFEDMAYLEPVYLKEFGMS